jgi:selenocysteine lyase/cysteine desulfurase
MFERFLAAWPDYRATLALDELRSRDYSRLDRDGHIYLDYTGGSLYADSQVRAHVDLLARGVFGNPHSGSLTSVATTTIVEQTRRRILSYFNAPPASYTVVFTQNATAALKLVGESYPFCPGSRYALLFDNHNSVNGIREFACAKGASVEYAPLTTPDLRLDRPRLEDILDRADRSRPNLFALPAQSNFSGVKHPLEIVAHAQERGWHVLLDAAAFVATSRIDLSAAGPGSAGSNVQPDFMSVSFYKMFGYPTGVGCLLVRNDAIQALQRPWFAGGTVNFATVQGRKHILAPREAGFEDGTLNYLSIPAVDIGLRHLERVGIDVINTRVRCLTGWLLDELLALRHANGRHMVRIYGPTTTAMRGGSVTMNFYDPNGHLLDYRRIEELASARRISLRTGCFCNPGAGETAEGLTEDDMLAGTEGGVDMTLPRFLQVIQHRGGKSAGAIRVSLGIASNFADVQAFVQFASEFRDQTRLTIGEVTFDIESCRIIRDGA